jgi:hypothetical protein
MAKLTAWLVTLVGVLLFIALFLPEEAGIEWVFDAIIAVGVLIVGIGKLTRNYKSAPKKRK